MFSRVAVSKVKYTTPILISSAHSQKKSFFSRFKNLFLLRMVIVGLDLFIYRDQEKIYTVKFEYYST